MEITQLHDRFHHSQLSARYTALDDEFYVPPVWRVQSKGNKQCSEGSVDGGLTDLDEAARERVQRYLCDQGMESLIAEGASLQEIMSEIARDIYELQSDAYKILIAAGAPKEQARFIGPVGQYTEIISVANLGDWMLWLNQRLHSHAQKEIRDYAVKVHELLEILFPEAMQAYDDYQRFAVNLSEAEFGIVMLAMETRQQSIYEFLRTASKQERKQFLQENGLEATSERAGFLKKLGLM